MMLAATNCSLLERIRESWHTAAAAANNNSADPSIAAIGNCSINLCPSSWNVGHGEAVVELQLRGRGS